MGRLNQTPVTKKFEMLTEMLLERSHLRMPAYHIGFPQGCQGPVFGVLPVAISAAGRSRQALELLCKHHLPVGVLKVPFV